MGVMGCHRNGCDNIMCDTYVNGVGYVCRECQSEFKLYIESSGIFVETEGEIKRELIKFMETEKDTYSKGKEMNIDEFFNEYTNKD